MTKGPPGVKEGRHSNRQILGMHCKPFAMCNQQRKWLLLPEPCSFTKAGTAEVSALTVGEQGPGWCQLADAGRQDGRGSDLELVSGAWLLPHRCCSYITLQLNAVLAVAQFTSRESWPQLGGCLPQACCDAESIWHLQCKLRPC